LGDFEEKFKDENEHLESEVRRLTTQTKDLEYKVQCPTYLGRLSEWLIGIKFGGEATSIERTLQKIIRSRSGTTFKYRL